MATIDDQKNLGFIALAQIIWIIFEIIKQRNI